VGLTAGASAPERLVEEVISLLRQRYGAERAEMDGERETVRFPLPKSLQ
jgi:4-hydroxy-3-methylbut-2-enyl diphosphate reductase